MPVLEALLNARANVTKVFVSRSAHGEAVERIAEEAVRRGVTVSRVDPQQLTRMSGNGRHDQGVVARVGAPGLVELDDWLDEHRTGSLCLLLLDGLTNPSNVGMLIRTAVAAGLDGVVLPRAGSPDLGPLVVKASAGVALFAPVLTVDTAATGARSLVRCNVGLIGLSSTATCSIWDADIGPRTAFVLGNETFGISTEVRDLTTRWCAVPLDGGVESLNVASAGTVVAFEVARRRST